MKAAKEKRILFRCAQLLGTFSFTDEISQKVNY